MNKREGGREGGREGRKEGGTGTEMAVDWSTKLMPCNILPQWHSDNHLEDLFTPLSM